MKFPWPTLPPAEYWLPWAELLRKTVGVDPEICACGARMIVDDAVTDGEKITETLARLGIQSTGPPKRLHLSLTSTMSTSNYTSVDLPHIHMAEVSIPFE